MYTPIEPPKKFTPFQIATLVVAVLLTVIAGLYLIISWPHLPQKLPSHFNFVGEPDAWSGKGTLLFLYAVNIFTVGLMTASVFFPKLWNINVKVTEENAFKVYNHCRTMLCNMTLIVSAMLFYLQVCSMPAIPAGVWFLPLTMIALFGQMIYSMIRIYKK